MFKALTMSSSYLPATTDSIAHALEAIWSHFYSLSHSWNPSSSSEALRIKEQAITNLRIFLAKKIKQRIRRIWSSDFPEKQTFLRQRVEARLASLLMESKEYSEALSVLSGLYTEVRRLVDKLLLVDIDLMRVSSISLWERHLNYCLWDVRESVCERGRTWNPKYKLKLNESEKFIE